MNTPEAFEFGPLRLQVNRRLLTRDGESIALAPKPLSLLLHLIHHQGQTLSKDDLIDFLWADSVGSEANLSVNIASIRRALGERPQDHRYVITVPMRGYSFVGEVRQATGGAPADAAGATNETAPPRPHLLAVLPFENPHPEPGDNHLGTGFADSITGRIPHLPDWAVQSPQTVRQPAVEGLEPLAAGRELEVNAVLTGVIDRVAGRRTISVRLLLVEDGSVLWGDTYAETAEGLSLLPQRIAEDVVRMVDGNHGDPPGPNPYLRCPQDQEAFQECLKGRFLLEKAGGEALRSSIEHFQKALELDPEYSLAHAGVAGAYFKLWRLGQVASATAAPEMESAARRAIELDAALADPYFWLANLNLVHHWDKEAARTLFERGLKIAPNSSLGRTLHAYYLVLAGRPDEALREAQLGQSLEPTNLFANSTVANILRVTGRVDAAISQFRSFLKTTPDFVWGHLLMGWTLLSADEFEQSRVQYEFIREITGEIPWILAGLTYGHARTGDEKAAHALIEKLHATATRAHVEPFIFAFAYLGLNDREATLHWLEKACLERNPVLVYQRIEPIWGPLHDDPEFKAIFDRIGAPSA